MQKLLKNTRSSMDYDVITTMTSRAALLQVLDSLQDELHATDLREHYRFWRMRLDEEYDPQLYGHNVDLDNVRLPCPCPPAIGALIHQTRRPAVRVWAATRLRSFRYRLSRVSTPRLGGRGCFVNFMGNCPASIYIWVAAVNTLAMRISVVLSAVRGGRREAVLAAHGPRWNKNLTGWIK